MRPSLIIIYLIWHIYYFASSYFPFRSNLFLYETLDKIMCAKCDLLIFHRWMQYVLTSMLTMKLSKFLKPFVSIGVHFLIKWVCSSKHRSLNCIIILIQGIISMQERHNFIANASICYPNSIECIYPPGLFHCLVVVFLCYTIRSQ